MNTLIMEEAQDMNLKFREFEKIGINSAETITEWINRKVVVDDFEFSKRYQIINKALRTNLNSFENDDISGVFLSNKTELNDRVKKIIVATEEKFDNYVKAIAPFVSNMYLITKEQLIRIYRKDWALEVEPDHDFSKDLFYKIATPENNPERKPCWTNPYYDSIWKHWMTSLITPIYIDDEFIGIVGHDIFLDDIYKSVKDKNYYNSGYVYLFDSKGNIIVHPNYLDKLIKTAEMGTPLNTKNLNKEFDKVISEIIENDKNNRKELNLAIYNLNGKSYYSFYNKLDILDWYFAIEIPEEVVIKPINKFRTQFIIGSVITVIFLFVVVITFIYFAIIVPIKNLTIVSNEIRQGNLDTKARVIYNDEIGGLTLSFNEMASNLKRRMIELKEAEEKYKTIFDNAVEGIYQTGIDGRILNANPSLAKILGFDDEKVLKQHMSSKLYVDQGRRDELVKIFNENDTVENYEIQLYKKDKSKIWVSINSRGVRNEKGELVYMEGFITDITRRKKTEESLNFSNSLLRTQLNTSIDGILIVDTKGKILTLNKKFIEMWNIPGDVIELKSDELAQVAIQDSLRDNEDYMQKVKFLYDNPSEKSYDVLHLKNDKIYERYSVSIISPDDTYYGRVWYFRDVTEQRKIQKEIIKSREKAVAANKLKSEFLAQVSHEIRTPINVILSFTSLLREELSEKVDMEMHTSFHSIKNAGKRIIRTIDLILNMSEIQSGSYDYNEKSIDILEDVILNIYAEYKHAAKDKGLELSIINEAENTIITADEYTVFQIFQNLIDNAIKYTIEGKIDIVLQQFEDKLTIKIVDTGIGISEDYLPQLFSAFSQEEKGYTRKFEGNGLGLALVKKYCELNNAEIEVKSRKNIGSTFSVSFQTKVYNYS
ncbi:MAG: PAS domain S-box protein [Ignavibacteria bacterium]